MVQSENTPQSITLNYIDNIHDSAERTVAEYLLYMYPRSYLIQHQPPRITGLKHNHTQPDFLVQSPSAYLYLEAAKGSVNKIRKNIQLSIMESVQEPYIQIPYADRNPHLISILAIFRLFLEGRIDFASALSEVDKDADSIYSVRKNC